MTKKVKGNPKFSKKEQQDIVEDHFRVAIFGSARIKEGDPRYKLVESLAKMLAEDGNDVVTGGGPGLMDAASRGHHLGRKTAKRKGKLVHSIGLTIKLPKEQHDGFHLDIKKDFTRFSNRLDAFMELSNIVVVAPGGIGTMLEFFYTWQLVQVNHICHIPIILLGDMWPELIEWVRKYALRRKLVNAVDFDMIHFAKTPRDVMKIVKEVKQAKRESGGSFCLNSHIYPHPTK